MLVPATPPPTITTRARSPSPSVGTSDGTSDRPGGLLEPSLEALVRHRTREAVEVLVRVGDVVDVQRGQTLLDHAPHRLAVVGHDPHQLQAGPVRVGRFA